MEKWGEMGGIGGKWGEMGGIGGKWGEMGGIGGKWEIAKNTLWGVQKNCVKLVGNGRKIGEKWDNLGQISHFPHFSTTLPPFPPIPLMNFASQTTRLGKWEFRDWPTLADFFFGQRRWLPEG